MRDIETSRLLLRAWRVNDAAEAASVFRYASDPLVGPRAGWPPHASVDESARIVRDVLAVENNWAIIVKFEGDGPVGSIALKPFSSQLLDCFDSAPELREHFGRLAGEGALEVGYWIGRSLWGRGYMTESLGAVLEYAFGTLGAPAVWGLHFASNDGSGRVMEKCGMAPAFEQRMWLTRSWASRTTLSVASSPRTSGTRCGSLGLSASGLVSSGVWFQQLRDNST